MVKQAVQRLMRTREPHRISSQRQVTHLITEYISICLYVSACACVRASNIRGDWHSSSLSDDDVIINSTRSIVVAIEARKIARIHRRKNGKIFRVTTQRDAQQISTDVLTETNVTLTNKGDEEFVISAEPRPSPRQVYETGETSHSPFLLDSFFCQLSNALHLSRLFHTLSHFPFNCNNRTNYFIEYHFRDQFFDLAKCKFAS